MNRFKFSIERVTEDEDKHHEMRGRRKMRTKLVNDERKNNGITHVYCYLY